MKFKALIFDMDGTSIHTEHIWQNVSRELLEKRSIYLSPDEITTIQKHMHGLSVDDCCLFLKDKFGLSDSVAALIHEKNKLAMDVFAKEVKFIEGFEQFIAQPKAHNLKMGIATNANDITLSVTNTALNLHRFFGEHIYGISQVGNVGKPHPAIFLHTAEKLETAPEECIVIEDSFHGIQAAKKAGMYCIGINTAKKRELLFQADQIVEGYEQIDLDSILKK